MASGASVYRGLVRLYPREFRHHYGDDLVLHFTDLVTRDGATHAWGRTLVDLLVTVPRYRMETLMNPRRSTVTVGVLVAAVALAGIAGFAGGYPVALLLVVVAAGVAIAERSHLAASLRTPSPTRRRSMLSASLLLALAGVATLVVGLIDLGDQDAWPAGRLIAYNALFFTCLVSAVVCAVAGFSSRRSSGERHATSS